MKLVRETVTKQRSGARSTGKNIFYETNNCEQVAAKINTEEDDQNIFLKNLDSNTEIQPIETLQQEYLPKDWKVPKDLSIDNIIGQIHRGVSTRRHVAEF